MQSSGHQTIYAATGNQGKLREFAECARGEGMTVLALPGVAHLPEPEETADSFAGNAALKAVAYSLLRPGLLVMADDSGLEVAALGGEPGVRSARFADDAGFAGEGSRDARNNALLLARMEAQTDRRARFVCALALARDGQVVLESEGAVDGELVREPRGSDGFGYDPLFYVPALDATMAELSREDKWRVSHRGRAFRELLARLHAGELA